MCHKSLNKDATVLLFYIKYDNVLSKSIDKERYE